MVLSSLLICDPYVTILHFAGSKTWLYNSVQMFQPFHVPKPHFLENISFSYFLLKICPFLHTGTFSLQFFKENTNIEQKGLFIHFEIFNQPTYTFFFRNKLFLTARSSNCSITAAILPMLLKKKKFHRRN